MRFLKVLEMCAKDRNRRNKNLFIGVLILQLLGIIFTSIPFALYKNSCADPGHQLWWSRGERQQCPWLMPLLRPAFDLYSDWLKCSSNEHQFESRFQWSLAITIFNRAADLYSVGPSCRQCSPNYQSSKFPCPCSVNNACKLGSNDQRSNVI